MHALAKYILWGAVVYVCYCILLFFMQRHMMYPRYMIGTPQEVSETLPGLERIWIDTDFGSVETWYLAPGGTRRSAPSPVVIFAHGNAELIDFWPEELLVFRNLGIGVLLVEYPGYGRSEGSPAQDSITQTFVRAYDRIAARPDVDAGRIILFGRSLGGGAVCALAGQRPTAALILMSAFTSARAFAPRYLVPGILVRDPFDNLAAVTDYEGPILVMHGKFDEVIPYRHGVSLAGAAKNGKLLTFDCGHNDWAPGWFGFEEAVTAFLTDGGILHLNSHRVE